MYTHCWKDIRYVYDYVQLGMSHLHVTGTSFVVLRCNGLAFNFKVMQTAMSYFTAFLSVR